jgi:hypothetical protein
MTPSSTHLVLIPSYNPGPKVYATVRAALNNGSRVVVIDGSTDHSEHRLSEMAAAEPNSRLGAPKNRGKGRQCCSVRRRALELYPRADHGFDGQHPAERIAPFMQASSASPAAMILGQPIFDDSAPSLRVKGRRISNWWANLETLWAGIDDSLFGFRVYPIDPLIGVMRRQLWMRRFDFDVEAVVRLCWRGVITINLPARVCYWARRGRQSFKYGATTCHLSLGFYRLAVLADACRACRWRAGGARAPRPSVILRPPRVVSGTWWLEGCQPGFQACNEPPGRIPSGWRQLLRRAGGRPAPTECGYLIPNCKLSPQVRIVCVALVKLAPLADRDADHVAWEPRRRLFGKPDPEVYPPDTDPDAPPA